MPAKPSAVAYPQKGLTVHSLQLSDVNAEGRLILIFKNYPVNRVQLTGYDASDNGLPDNPQCNFEQAGYSRAWSFFDQDLQSGHLCFEIPPTHRLWNLTNYRAQWLTSSLNGLGGIWKIMAPPIILSEEQPKQYCDFNIEIKHFLRSPAWV
jgi:hypothetical protein